MRVKRQWMEESRGSVALAVAHAVISVFEDSLDDPDPRVAGYEFIGRDPLMEPPPPGGEVKAVIYGLPGVLEERVLAGERLVVVEGVEGGGGRRLVDLYRRAVRAVVRHDGLKVRRLARETGGNGVEFLLLYLRSGELAVLEGDVERVQVPHVATAAGSIHTHPHGACGLSWADIRTGLDILVDGGIFEAAATEACVFAMWRRGLVSEDDYLEILDWGRSVWEPLELESIVFEVIPLG